jgi:hypothetical protein
MQTSTVGADCICMGVKLVLIVRGYGGIKALPSDYELRIRFTSSLINVRALARSLQRRPPDRYTQHQLEVLREDLVCLNV